VFAGVQHEGTPTGAPFLSLHCSVLADPHAGKIEKIGGVESYVATPEVDYPKDKVVLFLPDVFGHKLVNAQLLADDFAANGFKVSAAPAIHTRRRPLIASFADDPPGLPQWRRDPC
jgi:hypothetical protein